MPSKKIPTLSPLTPKFRPQDDFFRYANDAWLKANPIPASQVRWGAFYTLRDEVNGQVRKLVAGLAKQQLKDAGSVKLRDYYASGMDMRTRNRRGIAPLLPELHEIDAIATPEDLARRVAAMHAIAVTAFWDFNVFQDDKKSDEHIVTMRQGGLGMPDRDYYLKQDAKSEKVRAAYLRHVAKMLAFTGMKAAEAKRAAATVFAIERALAEASMTNVEERDVEKLYNKMSARKLAKDAPGMPWAVYFDALGVKPEHLKSIIVWQPKFMKAVGELVASTPLEDVKAYLRWHAVNAAGAYLGQEILEQDFWFHEKVLLGRKEMRPLWKQVVAELDSSVGELLGSEYVKVHFPPAAVKRMDVLIKDLIDAYEARIKALGWMSEPTKKQALIKLKATSNKIGFPKKPEEYKSLKVDPKSYLENRWQSGRFAMRKSLRRLGRPVDLQEWHMNAHAVNAYSNPNLNEIVFPAGILQAPFFHPEWSDALNYGAIGGVIGHELTHGFDDMGSKFDEKGNMRGWWRAADRRKFEAETQRLVKQFDACEVIDGLRCNGKLTLGENLADLGGMEIAYDAFRKRAGGTAQKKTRGLTPDQEFLLAFAQIECGTRRPEALRNQVLTDPHAPHELRVNETVKNMDVFHEAFGTKPGDQLYVKPEDRVRIW